MWEGLIWAAPVFAATFTMVFLFTDFVMFGTASDFDPTSQDVARQFIATWQVVTVATPLSLLWLLGIAAAPGLAMALSKGARIGVLDERPYPRWSDRAAVNLWEKKVVERSAWIVAAITAIVIILGTVAVGVLGGGNALVYACGVLLLLSAPPAWAMASMVAMRTQLRTVIYGPPGRYMRRDCPYALVAPAYGTRAERGKDPAVRAALRARMRADGSSDQDVLAQIDEIGEKLWLGSDELSTAERRVDPALIEQGQLPDFGGAAAAPAAHRVRAPERMDIPDTLEETAAQ